MVELIEVPVNRGEIIHPMDENPKRLIIYHPEDNMSAQIMNLNRRNFDQKDCTNDRPDEYNEEGSTYHAYLVPFKTDDEKQVANQTMLVSLFPN